MGSQFKLKVAAEDAEKYFTRVEHTKFQNAIKNQWHVGPNRSVPASAVCWLFCWAKTGQNSEKAMRQSRYVFNQIFENSFEWLDQRLNHELARQLRYAPQQETEELFWKNIRD